jgi:hypothetical protein
MPQSRSQAGSVLLACWRLLGLTRAVTVGLRTVWWLEAGASISLSRPSVGGRGSVCRRYWALRRFGIRSSCRRLGSVRYSVLCLLSVALGLLLDLLLLRRIFRNDGDEIRGNRSVEFEAVCKLLQVVQLDFLVIFDLSRADLINISSLTSGKALEGAGNCLLNSGCSGSCNCSCICSCS